MSKYSATIGIEVHVEVKSNSKLFSNSANTYGMSANSCVNVVDLGYPGVLPTVNKEVIEQGIRAAHILNCEITKDMHFDRKNYFYPDNSKNYQITQNRTPIGVGGYVEIEVDGVKKKIEIEEIHIEEDTCKSAHRGDSSFLDFNRAGVPLIEIVTKPCMKSGEESILYLTKLKELLYYGNISDCKIEEGSMRCDANVSISDDPNKFGTKCEIKNIGSIHNVGLSIDMEIKRQEKCLENGEVIREQTRRFDDKRNETILMRMKETGNDYRYFPEPDIPYIHLTEEEINSAIEKIQMLPDELRKIYNSLGISCASSEKIIANRSLCEFFNELLDCKTNFVTVSNLLLGDISFYLNKNNKILSDTYLTKEKLLELVEKLESGELSSKNIKEMINMIMEEDSSISDIMKSLNIQNITDNTVIISIIERIISENPDSVKDYKEGRDRALKYLMGQVMKETKGTVNPKLANDLLIKELNK